MKTKPMEVILLKKIRAFVFLALFVVFAAYAPSAFSLPTGDIDQNSVDVFDGLVLAKTFNVTTEFIAPYHSTIDMPMTSVHSEPAQALSTRRDRAELNRFLAQPLIRPPTMNAAAASLPSEQLLRTGFKGIGYNHFARADV